MIFNMSGGGRKKEPIIPIYSGTANIVLSEDMQSGYIECTSTGGLVWTNGVLPETVDITCVGGGSGGATAKCFLMAGTDGYILCGYMAGSGGGGGFVVTETGVVLPEAVDITIGAGGAANKNGGATSVGSLCSASGGIAPKYTTTSTYYFNTITAGSGGNYGGFPSCKQYTTSVFNTTEAYANGGSNGSECPAPSNTSLIPGTSQGTPTVDILGRRHAGGGAAGRYNPNNQNNSSLGRFSGGSSDFAQGVGTAGGDVSGSKTVVGGSAAVKAVGGEPGGGYGSGGGGGGFITYYVYDALNTKEGAGGKGGQGLVVIGWGDYLALCEAQKEAV